MLLLLATLASAQTLTKPQSGPTIEAAVGVGFAQPRVQGQVGGQLSLGWWFGKYDDSYGLGRFSAVAITNRVDMRMTDTTFRYSPQLELRRGMDLLVIAPHYLIAGGPVFDAGQVGVAGRIGGGLKLRRSRRVGIVARLVGGVDYVGGVVSAALSFTLGIGYSTPVQKVRD